MVSPNTLRLRELKPQRFAAPVGKKGDKWEPYNLVRTGLGLNRQQARRRRKAWGKMIDTRVKRKTRRVPNGTPRGKLEVYYVEEKAEYSPTQKHPMKRRREGRRK